MTQLAPMNAAETIISKNAWSGGTEPMVRVYRGPSSD
jgi:hypothetical protein